MRSEILKSDKGLQVRAIAGTHVVLLTFSCPARYRHGLLGFSIHRLDHENQEAIWLRGSKMFDLPESDDGESVSTRHHPIQKFHWGDYTAKAGRTYTYTVSAMKGKPGRLSEFDRVAVQVTCEVPERVGRHGHAIYFNRSAAASQQFASRFPNLPAGEVVDEKARRWLSRGLAEALIAFIDAARPGEGLHLSVYEFEKIEFFEALKRALDRGVRLEILYDAVTKNEHFPSEKSKPLIEKYGLGEVSRGRTGKGLNISHNKFMVRTGTDGKPRTVFSGSTNFTDNGIYGQSNVGHVVTNAALAQTYYDWHQRIWLAPDTSAAESRVEAMALTSPPESTEPGMSLVLSPRTSIEAIDECASLVSEGKKLVLFSAPFAIHEVLDQALQGCRAQVFGLLNKPGVISEALQQAGHVELAAAGALSERSILEQWQGTLHRESMHHSGVFIHTKILLVDPLSDNPKVVCGSANFSDSSSTKNDENQLFFFGDTAVADVYLGEFMRMFDHYHFRDYAKRVAKERRQDPRAGFLRPSDDWTDAYFGGERERLRLAFF